MWDFIRGLFMALDLAVYGLVESIFQVIVDLANIQLFNDTVIDQFASRLYIILGLVMLFKIMISFVQMLINPDKMDDKEQGVTSLLKRVVISLALIVLVPSIFDLARQVQTELLPVIPKVVLGVESDLTSEDSEAMNSVGRVMSFYTFLAFFNYDNQNCDDGSILGTGSRLDTTHPFQQSATIVSVRTAASLVNLKCPASTDPNGYRYKYSIVMSTVVGAYLLFVLVQIAVKIAIRTLKLGICEFVAPIPIASYIDPKMSKQTFDTWVNTCWKTYLDLFIRLIIVYFMIFVFQTVLTNDFLTALYGKLGGSIIRGSLVTVFIIVGVLQFAKEAPKFIGDMLGLKADGDLMGMFKGAWESAKTLGGLGVAGVKASMFAKTKSSEAGEGLDVQNYRAGIAAMSASGRFIAARLKGKSLRESSSAALDKSLSGAENSIKRTAAYTKPGMHATMKQVRESRAAHITEKLNSTMGRSLSSAVYEGAIEAHGAYTKGFDEIRDIGRKHKVFKELSQGKEAFSSMQEDELRKYLRDAEGRTDAFTMNVKDLAEHRRRLINFADKEANDFTKLFVRLSSTDATVRANAETEFTAKYGAMAANYGYAGNVMGFIEDGQHRSKASHKFETLESQMLIAANNNSEMKEFYTHGEGRSYVTLDANGNVTRINAANSNLYDAADDAMVEIQNSERYNKTKANTIGVNPPKNGGQ